MNITEITRRNIIDTLRVEKIHWHGRLGETDFLSRLYNLSEISSNDSRFDNAEGDIWQHRIMNNDWDNNWVYDDSRFGLMRGSDEVFLRFLCEMIHPVIRTDPNEVTSLVKIFNDNLSADGWELVEKTSLSGKPVYAARPLLVGTNISLKPARAIAKILDADYVSQQITRMEAAIDDDPELAIGTAKEFVETICIKPLKTTGNGAMAQ